MARRSEGQRSTVTGYLNVVQEERFRIMSDDGRNLLLTLSHKAPLTAADLCRYLDDHTHVTVEYEGEPNDLSGVAHSVQPR